MIFKLDGRVGGVGGDAAVVLLVPAHLDVALIAPGGAPAVLDDPEVLAAVGSVADSQDSVVKLGRRAVRLVVDALLVELQRKDHPVYGIAALGCTGVQGFSGFHQSRQRSWHKVSKA